MLREDPKEVEMNSLLIRVTIITRNDQYTIVMTMCHMQCFSFLFSLLMSSLLKPVYSTSLVCSFK